MFNKLKMNSIQFFDWGYNNKKGSFYNFTLLFKDLLNKYNDLDFNVLKSIKVTSTYSVFNVGNLQNIFSKNINITKVNSDVIMDFNINFKNLKEENRHLYFSENDFEEFIFNSIQIELGSDVGFSSDKFKSVSKIETQNPLENISFNKDTSYVNFTSNLCFIALDFRLISKRVFGKNGNKKIINIYV